MLNHLQIYAILVNWTSLILIVSVSITCSFLMWATQMDEAITHEKNFRDSVKSLVVQDHQPRDIDDMSAESSDGEFK